MKLEQVEALWLAELRLLQGLVAERREASDEEMYASHARFRDGYQRPCSQYEHSDRCKVCARYRRAKARVAEVKRREEFVRARYMELGELRSELLRGIASK